ncbi:hypothetical protein PMAYCL1PPCAC_11150 [Pristionchus mayeri]|uniref:F-box domain-containing protein n=1 Tax=Pristionchus mayeri TaxID=1317129 RepID=A0AAN5CDE3_9BILA|nr:hypothetical protein PMAYCL1PPCAC_11150 [Pristionchus mayeri]
MSAVASVVETSDSTSSFLSDLLGSIGMDKGPEKTFTDLNLKLLTKIVTLVPLRERMLLSLVSQQFRGAVRASVTSLNFYRDCLDCLPDAQVKEMLQQCGSQITSLNFDLFKSTFVNETSQWVWRQTVLSFSGLCSNLTELSILICNRHRLRDKDLVTIFEKCPHLTKLCVDAQFLNGHCFKRAPISLSHVEMEMCYRISDQSLRTMFSRFRKMKTLHFSQLLVLTDAHIALMVRCFRNLQELSIVSHVDTKYENLSGSGLAELGKLQKLRTLCLEGLGAVTDRTLTVISDPHSSPTSGTIASLSLAFCYNVSMHGLKHLGRMTSLIDLNIDGITKRDVSMGVEKIAAEGRLVRLFVAERTNLSPEALVSVVQNCPQLRLLDICNNEECLNWVTADKMNYLWTNTSNSASTTTSPSSATRAPLTILTDEHLAWNCVGTPEKDDYGRTKLVVVHINRDSVPVSELLPTNALSDVRPSELPPGLLAPHIRRGNRYRLLWAPLGPSKEIKVELFDEHDNGVSVAELALRAAQEAEENELERSSMDSLDGGDSTHSMEGVECMGFGGCGEEFGANAGMGLPWNGMGNEENMPPPGASLPSDFSFSPISADDDPHTKDWSMDVISLLLKTYAYEDGAMVGPMSVREGIILRPDGSVEDICSSILKVDASLRARYHMTAALSGARRYGPHSYNPRDPLRPQPQSDEVTEITSAIDDFLGGYVPDESHAVPPGGCPFNASLQQLQLRQPSLLHEFPFEREMLQPGRGGGLLSPFPPFTPPDHGQGAFEYSCGGTRPFDDDFTTKYGGHCENEAPPRAAVAADYYVPGGRVEGAGPKVAPMRYGNDELNHHQQREEYGSQHHRQQHRHRTHRGHRSVKEGEKTGEFHPPAHTQHQQYSTFVPRNKKGPLLSPPPSIPSSFPFPPPSHLLSESASGAAPHAPRPYGRQRAATQSSWVDANFPPATGGAKFTPHPYAGNGFRARPAGSRSSILKPRN